MDHSAVSAAAPLQDTRVLLVIFEDLAFMCEEMGFETGIDLDKLILAAGIAQAFVDHPIPGKVLNGGSLRALRR